MSNRRVRVTLAAAIVVTLAAGCSSGDGDDVPSATTNGPAETYVAVGAGESVGDGADRPLADAWPRVLYRTALDRGAVFVNAGATASTVADAHDEQLPIVREVRPTLVTVWLNVEDLVAGVPPAAYERRLTELVEGVRRVGRVRVLVANTPPVDQLPGYRVRFARSGQRVPAPADAAELVEAYNRATARAAAAAGAEVVDVHAVYLDAAEEGSLASLLADDGFDLSTEGHARIAEAFAASLTAPLPAA